MRVLGSFKFFAVCAAVLVAASAFAGDPGTLRLPSISSIRVLKIAAQEEAAVLAQSDGSQRLIRRGDAIEIDGPDASTSPDAKKGAVKGVRPDVQARGT